MFFFCIPQGAKVRTFGALGALRDALAQLTLCVWMTGGALGGDRGGRVRAMIPQGQADRFERLARGLISAYAISEQ